MPELAADRLSVSFFRQGSVPAATSFFAANRASRASAKVMSGNFPKVSVPRRSPRPPDQKSHRKAMVPAGLPCAYSPSRSDIFLVSEGGFLL